jgi:hypothetical protein
MVGQSINSSTRYTNISTTVDSQQQSDTMAKPMRVYIFGDQTFDIADALSSLILKGDDGLVQVFLEQACIKLKEEIFQLPSDQQTACPRFAKLLDLVPLWRAATLNPALSQALTCITHIATFLRQEHRCARARA